MFLSSHNVSIACSLCRYEFVWLSLCLSCFPNCISFVVINSIIMCTRALISRKREIAIYLAISLLRSSFLSLFLSLFLSFFLSLSLSLSRYQSLCFSLPAVLLVYLPTYSLFIYTFPFCKYQQFISFTTCSMLWCDSLNTTVCVILSKIL